MATYVSYYDCSGWESSIEVLNAQGEERAFALTAYGQDGGKLLSKTYALPAHATIRIKLNEQVELAGHQGKVAIESTGNASDQFPAIMTVCADGVDYKQGNRFFPFTRL